MAEKGERSYSSKDIANEKQEASKEVGNWLGDKKEITSIKDKNLKVFIESLSRINPDILGEKAVPFLLNSYGTLQNEASFKNIDSEEADQYMASIYSKIEELQRGGKREEKPTPGMEPLLNEFKSQRITLEKFLAEATKQTENLADSFKRLPQSEERKRWVDVEYRRELYTRFTPAIEPRFYTELSEGERRLFDARWQLARASFFKKTVIAFPEKMIENQDLILLTGEQTELLYKMPGVKPVLEWYAKMITSDKKIDLGNGKEVKFLDCRNEAELDNIRQAMRKEIFDEKIEIKDKNGALKKVKLNKDEGKEADAVAWNLIWCSNLIESMDSRYSSNKSRHEMMSFSLYSDDLRAAFHTQEDFETECIKGREWGAFGKWGVYQVDQIKEKFNFNGGQDEIKAQGTSVPSKFWEARRIRNYSNNNNKEIKGEIEIFFPECHPTTAMKSLWELEEQENIDSNNKRNKDSLLDCLLLGKEIKWDEIQSGFWGPYLPWLNRAVKLQSYFKDKEKQMEVGKFGYVKDWADPLILLLNKLKLGKLLPGDDKAKEFHNIKFWLVFAGTGGMGNVTNSQPTLSMPFEQRAILKGALRDRNVRYFSGSESLQLS